MKRAMASVWKQNNTTELTVYSFLDFHCFSRGYFPAEVACVNCTHHARKDGACRTLLAKIVIYSEYGSKISRPSFFQHLGVWGKWIAVTDTGFPSFGLVSKHHLPKLPNPLLLSIFAPCDVIVKARVLLSRTALGSTRLEIKRRAR